MCLIIDDDRTNYYQSLIDILCWAVELGRIDINVHTAMMSSFMAQPHVGHFEQVLHIFAYLKRHDHLTLCLKKLNLHLRSQHSITRVERSWRFK